MADVIEAYDIIRRMADGFEDEVVRCLSDNAGMAADAVREQMYSGLDGEGKHLSPTYDNDPYFDQPGYWHGRARQYKAWKRSITPPQGGALLNTPPRPDNVPNLFIDGTFFREVYSEMSGDELVVDVEPTGNGPDIVRKYGENLLRLGPLAVEFYNDRFITPRIWEFFADCGYDA